jgi:hypothetical protein
MKRLPLLAVYLFFILACARQSVPETNSRPMAQTSPAVQVAQQAPETSPTPAGANEKANDAPAEFSKVDFKNFSYPITWRHQTVTLQNGRREFFEDKIFYNAWFEFMRVDYIDLTGDESKEAVVDLGWVACGASCDGGSHLFYFYSMRNHKLKLLSRIETGAMAAEECGLKSFILNKRELVLETFRVCRFNGISVVPTYDAHPNPNFHTGKYRADKFTRFVFRNRAGRFMLQKREVLPFPQEDIGNYPQDISVSHD